MDELADSLRYMAAADCLVTKAIGIFEFEFNAGRPWLHCRGNDERLTLSSHSLRSGTRGGQHSLRLAMRAVCLVSCVLRSQRMMLGPISQTRRGKSFTWQAAIAMLLLCYCYAIACYEKHF